MDMGGFDSTTVKINSVDPSISDTHFQLQGYKAGDERKNDRIVTPVEDREDTVNAAWNADAIKPPSGEAYRPAVEDASYECVGSSLRNSGMSIARAPDRGQIHSYGIQGPPEERPIYDDTPDVHVCSSTMAHVTSDFNHLASAAMSGGATCLHVPEMDHGEEPPSSYPSNRSLAHSRLAEERYNYGYTIDNSRSPNLASL